MRIVLSVSILIMLFTTKVFAGDTSFEILEGKQDAFIVAQITSINDTINVKINCILMGDLYGKGIMIKPFKYYGG